MTIFQQSNTTTLIADGKTDDGTDRRASLVFDFDVCRGEARRGNEATTCSGRKRIAMFNVRACGNGALPLSSVARIMVVFSYILCKYNARLKTFFMRNFFVKFIKICLF